MHPIVSIKDNASGPFRVLVGTGSNKGDRLSMLISALDATGRLPGTRVTGVSSLYRTSPIAAEGGDFLNAVAVLETRLTPTKLLDGLKKIELSLGRTGSRSDARPIDLDILFFGSSATSTPNLVIPHPSWRKRRFVLIPLQEVCGETIDPISGMPVKEMNCMNQKPGRDVVLASGPEWYSYQAL